MVSILTKGLGKDGSVLLELPTAPVVLVGCMIYPAVGDNKKSLIIVELTILWESLIEELLPLIVYVMSKNGLIKAVSLTIVYEFEDDLDIFTEDNSSSWKVWEYDDVAPRLNNNMIAVHTDNLNESRICFSGIFVLYKLAINNYIQI